MGENAAEVLEAGASEEGGPQLNGNEGASTHMGNVSEGMMDIEETDDPIKAGNGCKARASKKGTIKLCAAQVDDLVRDIALQDCEHAPHLDACLLSLTKALKRGWSLKNEGMHVVSERNGVSMMFDRFSETKSGNLIGVECVPRPLCGTCEGRGGMCHGKHVSTNQKITCHG